MFIINLLDKVVSNHSDYRNHDFEMIKYQLIEKGIFKKQLNHQKIYKSC